MSIWLLAIVTAIYLGVAYNEFMIGNWPMTIVFVAYAVANIGLILAIMYSPVPTV